MKRAVQARACAAGVTALCALTLGLGAVAAQTGTAYAASSQDVLVPTPDRLAPRGVSIVGAGVDGVLEQEDGTAGYQFISTANSQVKPVPALDGVPRDAIFTQGANSDRVAYVATSGGSTQVVWQDIPTGTEGRVTLADGYLNPHVAGNTAIVSQKLDDGAYQYRLLHLVNGVPTDTVLPLPPGATGNADPVVLASGGVMCVVAYQQDGHQVFGLVNLVKNSVTALPAASDATSFSLTAKWLTWFSRQDTTGVRVIAPGSVGTDQPGIRELSPESATSEVHAFQAGDNILWYEGGHGPLNLTPITGLETPRVVLPDVIQGLQHPDGSMDVVSQAADSTRSVHHLAVDGSGLVFDGVLRTVQPVTYYGTAQAVGLDRGTLRFVNSVEGTQTLLGKDVGTGLAPVAGADLPAQPVSGPGRFADGGDEGLARLVTDPASGHDALVTADDPAPVVLPASGGRILDVSPQYVLYEAGDAAREQYVVDIAQNRIVRQQAHQAAVLDYATLWTPSTAEGGTAVATDLRTGAVVRTVTLHGADCVPDDLRTNGTLLYWNCSGLQRAAVQEIDRDRSYPAPSGDVLLSDHLMVAAGSDGTTLTVRSFLNDAEDPVTTISQVKARAAGDTRGATWSLDRRTGQLAWVDHDEVVHVNRPLMDTSLVSPLSVPDQAAPATFAAQGGAGRWDARWWLSKPARSWQVSLVDAVTGLTVRTWNGGEARSAVHVTWDAKSAAGALVTDGRYTWQLTATPADGQGALATASGTVTVTGAAPSPSGLFARDTTGTLWQYRGTGNASAPYGARLKVGTGWQIYTALVAPDGQRANATGDVVARDSAGVLWYYQGSGSPSAPLKARVRVGSGWNPYNRLVGVRDLTGDGRADMVARDGSGVLWLYRGTGSTSAPFAARVKIGAGWNAYGMLTGTGDVTGDGRADMVARDGSGVLWLYRGTGSTSAPFAARTKIGAGWNAYNALM